MAKNVVGEIVIGGGLALAGFLVAMWIVSRPVEAPADADTSSPKAKLSALSRSSGAQDVRRLIRADAAPSEIWAALESCEAGEMGKLFEFARTPATGAAKLNQLLVVARWIELDPAAATEASSRHPSRFSAEPTAVGLWAELDPEAALEDVNRSPRSIVTHAVYGAVTDSARSRDDVDLEALFAKMPADQQHHQQGKQLFTGDNVQSLKILLDDDGGSMDFNRYARQFAGDIAVRALQAGATPGEILEIYSADSNALLGRPNAKLLGDLYEKDPVATLEWIAKGRDPFYAARAGADLVKVLTKEAPEDAAKVLQTLPESGSRTELVRALAKSWAAEDHDRFAAWAEQLSENERAAIGEGAVDE